LAEGESDPVERRGRFRVSALIPGAVNKVRSLTGIFAVPKATGGGVATAPSVPIGQIFNRFWPDAKPYRKLIVIAVVLSIASPAVQAAIIWLFKLVVDNVLVPRELAPLLPLAAAYVGLTMIRGAISFEREYISSLASEQFVLDLRTRLFEHIQRLSMDFFEARKLGDILSRLTSDVAAIEDFMVSGVSNAIGYVARIVLFVSALLLLDARLAVVSLVAMPIFYFVSRQFSRRIQVASRESRRTSGTMSAVAAESLGNAPLVQAYNQQANEVARFRRQGVQSFHARMAAGAIRSLFAPIVDLVDILAVMLVLAVGTYELSQNRLTLGGLLVFMGYLSQLYGPIRGLSGLSNTVYQASAGAERIIEVLDQHPRVVESQQPVRLGRATGLVRFEDVSFRYPTRQTSSLSNVSFELKPGQVLALVGHSGAGKSTIIKLLLRFYDPDSGHVLLDGHDLRDLSLASLRGNVAVILQETLVFDGSVAENIAYGSPGASAQDVEKAARAAAAHDFITELPQGYNTVLGEKGRRLSGGQLQRISIARAVLRDAPLLVMDEPTTGLDPDARREVMEPMEGLMSKRTVIAVTHDLDTIRHADLVLVLDAGQVVEMGTHEELLRKGAHYARLHTQEDWVTTSQ
jgi:ABC-type multidrug transport system fused ATPase/permease subunit